VTDPNRSPSGPGSSTSLGLLERARALEPSACERIVHLYGPLVYGRCRRLGVSADDAPDVGQEVFAAAFRSLGDFRRDRPGNSFRAWLRVITDNKVRDYQRRQRGEPPSPGGSDNLQRLEAVPADDLSDSTGQGDTAESEQEEMKLVLQQAVELIRSQVNPKTWEAFRRVVMDGIAPALVGQELQMTADAVDQAKRRVLRRLRDELGDLEDFGRA
jgi:RNA polymerase sigma-70 factor (ECF subfamily)